MRDAVAQDAEDLCDLFNTIVRAGGTTAWVVEMPDP